MIQVSRWLAASLLAASLLISGHAVAAETPDTTAHPSIEITRSGARPSTPGPATRFTGPASVTELLAAHGSSPLSIGSVSFAPGARSNWHTHPAGQILIVTAGLGWVQQEGGPVEEMRPGDVVWIPSGAKHWHGASATTGVTHLAIQEAVDGRNVDWLEPVSDKQYHRNNNVKDKAMSEEPTAARKSFGDAAPRLAELTDKVLFGQVWADPTLSPRERSLVTITSLISLYRTNELPFHLGKALDNGLTKDEIIATITHLAFYAGWPPAMTALQIAKQVFQDRKD